MAGPDGQPIDDDFERVLDEVDDVLEEDAETFVKNYVQHSGNGGSQYIAFAEKLLDVLGPRIASELAEFLRDFAVPSRLPMSEKDISEAIRVRFGSDVADFLSPVLNTQYLVYAIDYLFTGNFRGRDRQPMTYSAPQADTLETRARTLVFEARFADAVEALEEAMVIDSSRGPRLISEFGYLIGPSSLSLGPDNLDEVQWLSGLWAITSATERFELFTASKEREVEVVSSTVRDTSETSDIPAEEPSQDDTAVTRPIRAPIEQSGATLETSFLDVLRRVFAISAESQSAILDHLRRQRSGTQFGHDLEFSFESSAAGSRNVRCHVECKNYQRPIGLKDIADKLLQQEAYWDEGSVDHFIVISPHSPPTNELSRLLTKWREDRTYPFDVQFWGPEEGVQELIAVEPAAFRGVYGGEPPALTQEEVNKRAALWLTKVAAHLRFDASWREYLMNPSLLCFANESADAFDSLFSSYVPLRIMDHQGTRLQASLETYASDWLKEAEHRSLMVLGEFGDGKSFFTYAFARRLLEEFRKNPREAWLPIRIALRDLRFADDPRALLERRLAELNSTIGVWRSITLTSKTLVILDGFDEVTVQLDQDSLTNAIRATGDLYDQLAPSKVLITSRTSFFESSRDQQRFLDHVGRPTIVRLAPIPRVRVLENLARYAREIGEDKKLSRIRRLYDPVGLASKPLFLQMIKDALPDLPESHFDEIVLYETYIRKSFTRKIEDLRDPASAALGEEIVENLGEILEEVAVTLQTSDKNYVPLKHFKMRHKGLAETLWRLSETGTSVVPIDTAATQDAKARVGSRSLLKPATEAPADLWPVTFFHRSLKEYFVAKAIARSLRSGSLDAPRELLGSLPLQPEIARFVLGLLRDSGKEVASPLLYSLARSAVIDISPPNLGGNALGLYYGLERSIGFRDWSGLNLDFAALPGADLSDARFVGSSLRSANLDNANLRNADFTNADLRGVRLEETAAVDAVASANTDDSILVAYSDGNIRRWEQHSHTDTLGEREVVAAGLESRITALHTLSPRLFVLWSRGQCQGIQIPHRSPQPSLMQFRPRTEIRSISFGPSRLTALVEKSDGTTVVSVIDVKSREVLASIPATGYGPVGLLGEDLLILPIADGVLGLANIGSDGEPQRLSSGRAVAVASVEDGDSSGKIAIGEADGTVRVLAVQWEATEAEVKEIWSGPLHAGEVTSLVFLSESSVASGSSDRSVSIVSLDPEPQVTDVLQLTLRCDGVKTEGVKGPLERALLERHRDSERS